MKRRDELRNGVTLSILSIEKAGQKDRRQTFEREPFVIYLDDELRERSHQSRIDSVRRLDKGEAEKR